MADRMGGDVDALEMARLALGGEAKERMRKACIDHARDAFHPAGYADVLYNLIQQEPNK